MSTLGELCRHCSNLIIHARTSQDTGSRSKPLVTIHPRNSPTLRSFPLSRSYKCLFSIFSNVYYIIPYLTVKVQTAISHNCENCTPINLFYRCNLILYIDIQLIFSTILLYLLLLSIIDLYMIIYITVSLIGHIIIHHLLLCFRITRGCDI